MKKLKKLKIRRIIIVITALMAILFGVLIFTESKNNKEKEKTGNPSEKTHEEQKNSEKSTDEIEEIHSEHEEQPDEPPAGTNEEPFKQSPEEADEKIFVETPESIHALVNRVSNLPSNYIPENLVSLNDVPTVLSNPEVNQLRSEAYEALKELFNAAKDEEDYILYARSGYRSYNTQISLYASYVENYGKTAADKYSAKPGQSEHQTGLSLDITCEAVNLQLSEDFGDTDEGKWVAENAHRFGFIVRYPKGKEDITGYNYEPWHIRYLGEDLAGDVYESGLTLEEYFEKTE